MTRLDPTLQLARLVVTQGGHVAYDERFHNGVNIIRSVGNSRGKSTIADFIFFALGGDISRWKDEAELCDSTYAEVRINGGAVTLQRSISRKGQQPMSIFVGDYETASKTASGWQRYPYGRAGDKASFTQVLFSLLGFPEVPGDAGANITMHQCLRLMYVDQMTPVNRIFRFEVQDSPRRRQAVGDLLCGILDHNIYANQLALRDRTNEYNIAEQSLKGIFGVLDKVGQQPSVSMIDAELADRRSKNRMLLTDLERLKKARYADAATSNQGQDVINELNERLSILNGRIAELTALVRQQEIAVADAAMLIAETEQNLRRLDEGNAMRDFVGSVSFQFCPACLSPISAAHPEDICSLCKTPLDKSTERTRFLRLRNEIDQQLRESRALQQDRKENSDKWRGELPSLMLQRDALRHQILSLTRNYVSDTDPKIEETMRQLGYLESEVVELERKRKLTEQLQLLIDQKAGLRAEIDRLEGEINRLEGLKRDRERNAYSLIEMKTLQILAMDDHNDDEFAGIQRVHFDFGEDVVFVDGKTGFSASGLAVIRNAFHLALLWTSTIDRQFLYPRFILMDNIEDKGMTEERSRNFQRKIAEISDSIKVDHQIVFTTSTIAPELDVPTFTVGDKYTSDNKSLKVSKVGLQVQN